jgi:hypothetical protein
MSILSSPGLILCRFGRHAPAPDPVWNRGYWFSSCARCGADLVRTAAGRWHVPKGRKIVWKQKRPRGKRPGK